MKRKKKSMKSIFAIMMLLLGLLALAVFGFSNARSNPTGEVDLLTSVEIGGMQQWIMANGKRADLPVLLWLHGGPGSSQMPVARAYNSNLEDLFIVVHWDQRGAGKSNPRSFDPDTMTVERYVQDVHEMTQHLKARFGKEKIYLLGHSWGSQIGMLAVHRSPENYVAYVGVSQVADHHLSHQAAFTKLKGMLSKEGREKDLHRLLELQGPPYEGHGEYLKFSQLLNQYGLNMDVSMPELIRVALRSRAYGPLDYARWLSGANRGSGPMWQESQGWTMANKVDEVEVPVFFITGEDDFNTPLVALESYFEMLHAPEGKTIFAFPEAAHLPFFNNPDLFHEIMRQIQQETLP